MKKYTWLDFKKNLTFYPELKLKFIYNEKESIFPNYHITEFKLATIESVDCGGNYDTWKEIVLQVLEPNDKNDTIAMTLNKINSIVDKVSNSILIPDDAILRIEFGNTSTAMRQYFISDMEVEGSEMIMYLKDGRTECKASSSCGIQDASKKFDTSFDLEIISDKTSSACCQPKTSQDKKTMVGCC